MSQRNGSEQAAIRECLDGWNDAIRGKDLARVLSYCAEDILVFDLAPPLVHDAGAHRKGLAEWFPTFAGRVGIEVRDLEITASTDVAFAHSLVHLSGERTSGEETDVWVRSTVCLRKIGGNWRIVHEHVSVPFEMDGSYRASVDLQP